MSSLMSVHSLSHSPTTFDGHSRFQSPVSIPDTNVRSPLPPPIILESTAWRQVAGKLFTLIPEFLTAKTFRPTSVKIQCSDVDSFRAVKKHFSSLKTQFHTFSLPIPQNRHPRPHSGHHNNKIIRRPYFERIRSQGRPSVRRFQ